MDYKVSDNFKETLTADLETKYLGCGVKLGGSIIDNKIKLFTTDGHGKHSKFAARIFCGKLSGNILSGKFSPSLYVIILLGILTGFCIESIVMAIISGSVEAVIFPIVIMVVELVYFLSLKRISAENDSYIKKYLEDCAVED